MVSRSVFSGAERSSRQGRRFGLSMSDWRGGSARLADRAASSRAFACAFGSISGVGIVGSYGLSPQALELSLFSAALIVLSRADIRARVIPNSCVFFAFAIRFAYLGLELANGVLPAWRMASYCLAGFSTGFVLASLSSILGKVRETAALGGGDVKLLAVSGFYFGWNGVLRVMALACSAAALIAVFRFLLARDRRASWASELTRKIPLGPYVSAACVMEMLIESPLLSMCFFAA